MIATLDGQRVRDVFTSPDSFATTLLTLFVDMYGTEGFSWDPETIRLQLNDDLQLENDKRNRIPEANLDRLMAAINLILSDDFYKSLPDFVTYCNVLAGDAYDPRTWDPNDAVEIAWGITEGLLISPPDDNDDTPFTEEITAYIGTVLNQEGIINPPDVLKIAIRDIEPATVVAGEYADDPAMFSAIYSFESGKTEEINNIVKASLQRLSDQLALLPLQSGSAVGAVQQMLRALTVTTHQNSVI